VGCEYLQTHGSLREPGRGWGRGLSPFCAPLHFQGDAAVVSLLRGPARGAPGAAGAGGAGWAGGRGGYWFAPQVLLHPGAVHGQSRALPGSAGRWQWRGWGLIIQPLRRLGNAASGVGMMGTSVRPLPRAQTQEQSLCSSSSSSCPCAPSMGVNAVVIRAAPWVPRRGRDLASGCWQHHVPAEWQTRELSRPPARPSEPRAVAGL